MKERTYTFSTQGYLACKHDIEAERVNKLVVRGVLSVGIFVVGTVVTNGAAMPAFVSDSVLFESAVKAFTITKGMGI